MEKFLEKHHNCKNIYNIHKTSKKQPDIISYDNQGFIKRYKDYIFKWDNLGRLLKCIKSQNGRDTLIVSFEYDYVGFRTKKITPQAIIDYCLFYQRIYRLKPTQTENFSTNCTNICTNCTIEIEYLHNTLHLKGFVIKHNNQKDIYTFKLNYLNDIVSIYNSDNIEIVRYLYKPHGKHTISVKVGNFFINEHNDRLRTNPEFMTNLTIAKLNTYRAKSRLYDQETGLYYYNDNYYSPKLNAFLKPSDIEF